MCNTITGKFEVDIMEAIAARHALSIAIEAGFRRVILETDNIKLAHHLSKKKMDLTAFGNMVEDILRLASQCQFGGNNVAHKLAKYSSEV
ncbi:3-deoxy-manno-octulosonate cytidylyltransferase [Bienertia sinuspersici]